jgi:DNA-binding response OmpR family regulator
LFTNVVIPVELIGKPYSPTELAAKIRAILDRVAT